MHSSTLDRPSSLVPCAGVSCVTSRCNMLRGTTATATMVQPAGQPSRSPQKAATAGGDSTSREIAAGRPSSLGNCPMGRPLPVTAPEGLLKQEPGCRASPRQEGRRGPRPADSHARCNAECYAWCSRGRAADAGEAIDDSHASETASPAPDIRTCLKLDR